MHVSFQVLGKEYSKAKWSSKDKLGKWAGSKNKKADVGIPAKPQKRKRLKVNTYKMQDEEERQRICMSYAEDSMPDFLLKFGTVTKLIEDVSEFEMKLKAAEESFAPWRKRRLWKAHRGRSAKSYTIENGYCEYHLETEIGYCDYFPFNFVPGHNCDNY